MMVTNKFSPTEMSDLSLSFARFVYRLTLVMLCVRGKTKVAENIDTFDVINLIDCCIAEAKEPLYRLLSGNKSQSYKILPLTKSTIVVSSPLHEVIDLSYLLTYPRSSAD